MGRYIRNLLLRLGMLVANLLLLHSLSFFLLRSFPGSPLAGGEESISNAVKENLLAHYGFQKPVIEQFWIHIQNLFNGSLGYSLMNNGQSVFSVITQSFEFTFVLALSAWTISLMLSVLFSIYFTFVNQSRKTYLFFTVALLSMPSLFMAPLLLWIFAFQLEWFPVALLETWKGWVLPIAILSVRPTVSLTRILKKSMESVLESQYFEAAQAFGFSDRYIQVHVVLKNSLVPFLSHLVPMTAALFAGNVIVERLFGIPGVGSKFLLALQEGDVTLVVGLITFFGAIVMLAQFFVDVLVNLLDPRQRNA